MQLIIAEKSTAAETIAENLGESKIKTKEVGPVKIWFTKISGEDSVIVPLKGHITDVRYPESFKKWDEKSLKDMVYSNLVYVPSALENVEVIKTYAKNADKAIIATDYDTEGEAIGFEAIDIIKNAKKDVKFYRSVFSSLTAKELGEAFKNLQKPDNNLADSANARREIDLILGAVLTRFISLSAKRLGNSFLSVGRVQTPTLTIIVDREAERRAFKPKKFWRFLATLSAGKSVFGAEYSEGRVFEKKTAEALEKLKDEKTAELAQVKKRIKRVLPPTPFNTTDFLRSASSAGFSVPNAMRIIQSLYMKGYVSYPRTDSQAYPPTLDIGEILNELGKSSAYRKHVDKIISSGQLHPTKGKEAKDHPPIHPVKLPNKPLSSQENKIFDLISRRFLATLSEPSEEELVSLVVKIKDYDFSSRGTKIISPGWREVYIYSKYEENILPELTEGMPLKIQKFETLEDETTPPPHHSQGGILKIMEDMHLGTKATRPEMLKKLMERRYISSSRTLIPSEIAFAVTENLKKISPELTGAGLTAHIEDEMKKVELGEKSKKEVVDETREIVDKMLSDLMKKKSEIKELMHEALLKQYIFGKCPNSGGDLRMIISKKTHKRFVGCGDYPKCHFGMPLPQSGYMFISPQICPKCGIHMIEWKSKDKPRTYVFCVNPACKVEKKAVAETKKPTKRNQSDT